LCLEKKVPHEASDLSVSSKEPINDKAMRVYEKNMKDTHDDKSSYIILRMFFSSFYKQNR